METTTTEKGTTIRGRILDLGELSVEVRLAKLEAGFEHMQADIADIKSDMREFRKDARADFRLLFGALIFVALGLAGIMAKGFGWL